MTYVAGPLSAALAHNTVNTVNAASVDTGDVRNSLIAGSYDFGMVKASLGLGFNSSHAAVGTTTADSRDTIVGVTVPYGATKFMASYVRKNDRMAANNDANQIGLGVMHSLSKRTDLYASYARIDNSNGSVLTVGNNSEAGSNDRALAVGIRHSF